MADFRENVLPVVFNSLFSEKNDARNIKNDVEAIKQNQILTMQKSGSLQDFISRTHSYLSSSKDRITGLILVNQIIQQCNTEIFQQHSPTWLRLLIQILQGHALPSVYRAACHLMGQVLQFSRHFTDLSRDIVATTIPQLVLVLLAATSEWRGAALRCITECLQTYPGPMTTHRNKIETLALNELEEYCCPKEATECLCHLVRCGGGGNQGNKHTDNWGDLCDRLIGSLQETLSMLYEGLEAGSTAEGAGPGLTLRSIGPSQSDRLCQGVRRWTVLSTCLQTLLGTEFHAVARIPADVIIKLVCRCLAINRKMLMSRPTAERTSLAMQLPIIHIGALKILKQLTLTCRTVLVPYCRVVMGYLSQELLWTHWQKTEGGDKPYGTLRSYLYEVLCVWLKVMDGSSGFLHEEKCVIKEILHDVSPEKDTLKIDTTSRTATQDGPPVKKKHKGGNYEVSQGISSQRKMHSNANSKLVQSGLDALYWIVTTMGPELERKSIHSIQEFSVKTILLIQSSNTLPVPYSIPECRKGVYRVLLGLALMPHPTAPPLIQCATRCFSVGQQDKNAEVSSFCLEALRTCEVLIHPRVPCLNGPIICENLVHISSCEQNVTGTSVSHSETLKQPPIGGSETTPSTSQYVPSERNPEVLQNENDDTIDTEHADRIPIVYSPVNDTIVSEHENVTNEEKAQRGFRGPTCELAVGVLTNNSQRKKCSNLDLKGPNNTTVKDAIDSVKETTIINAEDDSKKASNDDMAVMEISDSDSDSSDQLKKRTRKMQDLDDGPSIPKYIKLKDSYNDNELENTMDKHFGHTTTKINGDVNGDICINPEKDVIDLDDSSSDSSTKDLTKSSEVNGDENTATKVTVANSPKPSTSNAGAIDIVTDDSSSSDEIEIGLDANKNKKIEKDRTDIGKDKENGKHGVISEETFITTDSDGNKEVLTAIPITNLDSDEEENLQSGLQNDLKTSLIDSKEKEPSPDVQAMLSTFVDADPDPE